MNDEWNYDHSDPDVVPSEDTTGPAPAEQETPETVWPHAETEPLDAPAVTPDQEPPRVAEPYRPEEEGRSAYSDAGYVPSSDATAVPKNYYCAAPPAERREKKPRRRRSMGAGAIVALCLVCVLLGGGVVGGVSYYLNNRNLVPSEEAIAPTPVPTGPAADGQTPTTINRVPSQGSPLLTNEVAPGKELSATEIYYGLARKQTVGITTEITYTNRFGFASAGAVSGSGFFISSDGYILTNHHVISEAVKGNYEIKVLTESGEEYVATVVGYEEENDVAILKVDGTGFDAATIGDSDDMLVGETVYAVGNPLGELEYTMTDGMVSALDREITTSSSNGGSKTINMFQISAAINEGNSGGPVYNSRGEVIGISTAKYSETGVEGLGFAIPINDAVKIATDLITDGYVRGKAYMGVEVGTVTPAAAQYYGLVEGAIVASVTPGSCAEKAGLKESDIIVALDDKAVASRDDLVSVKRDYRAGDSAVLKVYRGGDYLELTIVFDEATPNAAASENDSQSQAENSSGAETMPNSGDYGSYSDFFNEFFGGFPFSR